MQDIKRIQENPELFKQLVKDKNISLDIDSLLEYHEQRSTLQQQIESLRQERNLNVDAIKKVQGKPPSELITKGKEIKLQLSDLEEALKPVEEQYKKMLYMTPQTVSEDTPVGKDDSDNVEVRRWAPESGDGGNPKAFDFDFKDHIELGTSLNILDLDRGTKTAGFRGYYLKNEGALMHMGLMMHGMKLLQEKGFQMFVTPTIVKADALWGSGHFPFDEENIYTVESLKDSEDDDSNKEKKFLIGTSEPSLLNYHSDEVLDESQLPLKLAGFSQCYRSEIGSYGRDTRGIYRIHEFMKIEQVVICKNSEEEAEKFHNLMISYSEELLQSLKLPYRLLQICTGDMGAGKYKMYDIETWMPSRESYGETHSASNLLDWQTRRLNLRVQDAHGEKYYPYALNNTVVASPRILIAIWENYQNSDGSITVPEVLREYVGTDIINQ
ncbi:serine--tRNA ligase [Candidatus Dojkabacteria bacterium]|uniref:Serine--tRNA ligase n=1 Tax=Candidatus Dojkabacteria bacterium TaxID=2099670 RepID=A0A955L873_9BACT|nr:serine--tRNA ligase [Candidatus Dojkabacteria bacterium]